MCGIISIKNLTNNNPVNDLVKMLYLNQKDRGQEGYGFLGMNKTRLDLYRATDEKGFFHYLNNYSYDEIVLHHRFPTSTKNNIKSTHPFIIPYGNKIFYFLHNGIIHNSEELKAEHGKRGIRYQSQNKKGKFNDSEALGWDFVLWLHNEQAEPKAQGNAAFICLETDKQSHRARRLYFGRNSGSPLRLYRDGTMFCLSSEGLWGETIKDNQLYFYDYQDKQIKKHKKIHIKEYSAFSWYDDYYFEDEQMEAEIMELEAEKEATEKEQSELLLRGEIEEASDLDEYIESLKSDIEQYRRYLSFSRLTSVKQNKLPF